MLKIDKEIVGGSIVLLIVFNLYSFLNFIFQSSMARLLSVSDYAILAALGYFVYFAGMFSESVQTIVARHSAAETDAGKLKGVIKSVFISASKIAGVVLAVYLIVMIFLSKIAEIPYALVLINGLVMLAFLLVPVTRGVLQGRKRFLALGSNMIIEAVIKIALGVGLVWAGWRVYGALIGLAVGLIAAFALSFIPLRKLFGSDKIEAGKVNLFKNYKSFAIVIFSLMAFYSIDLLLAVIIFPKNVAGVYSVASILSKIIFWGTQPISKAMFPIMVGRKGEKDKSGQVYMNAFALVSVGILVVLAAFLIFPNEIVGLFSGKNLPGSASILIYLGLAMGSLSYANLNILYKFSRGTGTNEWYFVGIVVAGIILMSIFNSSLLVFSIAFLLVSLAFLVASIVLLE